MLGCIRESAADSILNIEEVTVLNSPEDVATLVDTYLTVRENRALDYHRFCKVYFDEKGYYYISLADQPTNFDLLNFVNEHYMGVTCVTYANIGLLYPKKFSRGVKDLDSGYVQNDNLSNPGFYNNVSVTPDKSSTTPMSKPSGFVDLMNDATVKIGPNYTLSNPFKIGRSTAGDVQYRIYDNKGVISRYHCVMYYDNNDLYVLMEGKTNGVFINNENLPQGVSKKLNINDDVRLYNYSLRII